MTILLYTLLAVHVAVSVLIVLAVLMQRPRSEGLGAAFGGGMTDNLFGAQTTHVLAKFTTTLGITFFVLTLGLATIYSRGGTGQTQIQRELLKMTPPAAASESATPTSGTAVVDEAVADPKSNTLATPATPVESVPPAPQAVDPGAPSAPLEAAPGD